jgi:hypothetical protein
VRVVTILDFASIRERPSPEKLPAFFGTLSGRERISTEETATGFPLLFDGGYWAKSSFEMAIQPDNTDEILDQLLQEAAAEKDRARWMQLLRKISRIRAERWLKSPRPVHRERIVEAEVAPLDIFSGVPDANAVWIERVKGIDEARRRIHEIAAENPGEYFVFQPRSHAVLIRINSRIRYTAQRKLA